MPDYESKRVIVNDPIAEWIQQLPEESRKRHTYPELRLMAVIAIEADRHSCEEDYNSIRVEMLRAQHHIN